MVLFKRKPVQLLPPKDVKDDNAEVRPVTLTNDATSTDGGPQVWHIPQTGEVFAHYEDYLTRMDFYKQRRFICQITGHSGLTFFEALKSELAGAEEVEQAFPEALKGPVLRRVQFQTVSRIDALVDLVFDEFRADYYPGEAVTVSTAEGERLQGVVREKTRFGGKVLPDGTQTAPYTRYTVSLDDRPGVEAVVDDDHIFRDRKIFTKSVLRSFIKKTVTREAWNGAPWLVKHDVAAQYHIDSRIPPHLRYDTKLMERKQLQAQKRASHTPTTTTTTTTTAAQDAQGGANGVNGAMQQNGPARLPELKPAPKNQKGKHQSPEFPQGQNGSPGMLGNADTGIFHAPPHKNPFQLPLNFRNQPLPHSMTAPEPPPPPPLPKYPIEDLQVPLREGIVRPPLAFLCRDPPTASEDVAAVNGSAGIRDKMSMKSVGPFLETWDTLNVYCEIFKLDSFTFDDFVEAMCVASADTTVQLFEEIHCAVLKQIVSGEADGGKVNVQLPELDDEEDSDEESDEEEEEAKEPTPETDRPPARATRSSLAKAEAERLLAEARAAEKESQNAEPEIRHRAEDVLEDYDWIEELRKRNFQDGGWERIMVGLLHQLSKNERLEERCEDLLAQLCPPDVDPTQDTVRERYAALDVDYRVQALQIVCMLTTQTKAMRTYMEECSEQMTAFRKEKIDWQRQRKQAIEELRALNDQRKILLPENMPPPSPPTTTELKADEDVKMTDADESVADAEDDGADSDEEGGAAPRRNFRRANDRAAERQRKRREEKERKEKAAEAAKAPKQSKQFLKVLKDIQKKEDFIKKCEEEIAVIDNDLREADCGRTRVLGKDRFWNRYYWFERNGMPYGGLPDSSTAAAEYANGCIWVQGPDELERQGYIDTDAEYLAEYKSKFDMTVLERKRLEEGATSVFNAQQWGYYSEPEQVNDLLKWLDPRGFNELRLRKEIVAFRDKIIQNMENRKKYLGIAEAEAEAEAEEEEEEEEEGKKKPEKKDKRRDSKRMSTRVRQHEPTPEPTNYRCLAWENTTAVEELGHLHSEPPPPPPPPRSKKQTAKKRQAVEPSPEPAPAAKTRRRK
ncbi:Ddt domain-containing protein [Colletotrichum higginsianum IMI 349063]|uniref:Ddt domain-containing protein n=1 Tax=Colletotrichum higginsianum (strain IMI 349063) TaxID=759273 RepID=A0A1B7YQN6_COLHI|nr:Ddt domain-containing protein [Colletotrichum higginsianum IMI 349063]OBR14264.1 Ddt domain-containing protein [Colletotrichum higginsianum IMI 349063]